MCNRAVIEAKLSAYVSVDQLRRYNDRINRLEGGHDAIKLLLTLDDVASEGAGDVEGWRVFRYSDLIESIKADPVLRVNSWSVAYRNYLEQICELARLAPQFFEGCDLKPVPGDAWSLVERYRLQSLILKRQATIVAAHADARLSSELTDHLGGPKPFRFGVGVGFSRGASLIDIGFLVEIDDERRAAGIQIQSGMYRFFVDRASELASKSGDKLVGALSGLNWGPEQHHGRNDYGRFGGFVYQYEMLRTNEQDQLIAKLKKDMISLAHELSNGRPLREFLLAKG